LFNSKTILGSQTSVDDASAELSKNIDLAASHSLKKKITKNKKKQVNQKWFDLNLKKMGTHLFNDGKMFSKYQKDLYIRNHFYKLQKEYNKTRK
jgi:post-segregation antitoxin (ccd killing protein)